jgi:hypothetical protein
MNLVKAGRRYSNDFHASALDVIAADSARSADTHLCALALRHPIGVDIYLKDESSPRLEMSKNKWTRRRIARHQRPNIATRFYVD